MSKPLIAFHSRPKNREYHIQIDNLCLRQVDFLNGEKHNEGYKIMDTHVEMCDPNDSEFKPLFIALHNYKIQNGLR